ncbi:hypothetical protein HDG34_000784 [Paraburkholderia sp. HC6.4b]|uniref:hypothetical protein n=1 Tax=unclassified Paraburkholderia TaxID=2615204 RepID=UPI00160B8452|nr:MULTISPECIES: hypothetical protein [unclassified Paraburkholderia]MBB5406863.1 hypothetical protein [Paraburkholderia sp. HC6.4b]MBB5449068.1 hypothetical protein [Paraburkholderia sp. Kb1A]
MNKFMTKSKKSWAVTVLCCFVAAAMSTYVNFVIYRNNDGVLQPDLVIGLHVAAAFLGAGLLARFILGSREAMNEPVPGTVWGTTYIARVGEYSQRVRGKSAFFSTKRTAQLLGFVLCLMCQFVFVAAPAQPDGLNRDHGGAVARALPA